MKELLNAHQIDDIYGILQERLSPSRVLHALGSAHTAVSLAHRWGCNPHDALLAGLLHDIAKDELPSVARERISGHPDWFEVDDEGYPAVWHAILGAIMALEEFGASEDVARAIRLHPTGDAHMTLLDQILFLADYTEPNRTFEGVQTLRKLGRENLGEAVRQAILSKTDHVSRKNKPLHPRSQRARVVSERRPYPS
ncbi:HD domain-containing protein [bacterium]|nr:HD domain-containing protein [bacterium]